MATIDPQSIWEGAPDPAWGVFSDDPELVWLVPGDANNPMNRLMRLTGDFTFTDRCGKPWLAPAGLVTDGTSIPRALWTLVGSPFTGAYRRAALTHDYQCDQHPDDGPERRAADEMFYEACRAGGCSPAYAHILYLGVRIGSTVGGKVRGAGADETGGRVTLSKSERDLQAAYRDMAKELVGVTGRKRVEDDAATAVEAVKAVMRSRGFPAS